MCTAAVFKANDLYFGRTLDYDYSFNHRITVTPRNFPLCYRFNSTDSKHLALIGMAYTAKGYPLYYDGVNEAGLCMAGLNFVGNAKYREVSEKGINIAQFELIPWVLSRCETLVEAQELIKNTNITATAFSPELPAAELHWLIADRTGSSVTLEVTAKGTKLYKNTVGVLTNNPPFNEQMTALSAYMGLSPKQPENRFSNRLDLKPVSRGLGAMGLPGDLTSTSRFVRAAFVKLNSVIPTTEDESVNQFFHILGSVEQVKGSCITDSGGYESTIYTACMNADKGVYYYTTYNNHQITAVDIHKESLDGNRLYSYPLVESEQILFQN